MLAAIVLQTGGSLEYNLVLGFDGNLLACLRIDALTFSLLLDVETAKVGNGHLLLFFSETICYYTENGIYGFAAFAFMLPVRSATAAIRSVLVILRIRV